MSPNPPHNEWMWKWILVDLSFVRLIVRCPGCAPSKAHSCWNHNAQLPVSWWENILFISCEVFGRSQQVIYVSRIKQVLLERPRLERWSVERNGLHLPRVSQVIFQAAYLILHTKDVRSSRGCFWSWVAWNQKVVWKTKKNTKVLL